MIYFNELLYVTMRLFFRDLIKKNQNPQALLELKRNEEHVYQILDRRKSTVSVFREPKIAPKRTFRLRTEGNSLKENDQFQNIRNLRKKYINPLYEFFFNVMLLKTWKRYTVEKLQKFQHFETELDKEED